MDRRAYLSLVGVTALALGDGCLAQTQAETVPVADETHGEWELVFEDTFDRTELDADWSVGWGWGHRTTSSPTVIVDENVTLADSKLRLAGTHSGEAIRAGAVNTKNAVTFGPGTYLEARIKFADRPGFLNAFWSKPNSERWPPEIDVVELWQEEDSPGATSRSHHHLHYSSSTTPGDSLTHQNVGTSHRPGGDLTETFHTYGVEWQADRIVHFVDGQPIKTWTDTRILSAMGAGAPFYMMLSLDINRIGEADPSVPWGEAMVVDWVRCWHHVIDEDDTDRHYLWVRSADAELATFTFRATGGNIELDVHQNNPGYWISDDRRVAGGAVASSESLPGFWYNGEIADFSYSGPLDVFVDDEPVDPERLSTDSN